MRLYKKQSKLSDLTALMLYQVWGGLLIGFLKKSFWYREFDCIAVTPPLLFGV